MSCTLCFSHRIIWHPCSSSSSIPKYKHSFTQWSEVVRATCASSTAKYKLETSLGLLVLYVLSYWHPQWLFVLPKPSLVSLLLDRVCVWVCASVFVSLWEWLHFKVWSIRTSNHLVGAESERLGWAYYSWQASVIVPPSRKIYSISQQASVLTSVCGLLFKRGFQAFIITV